MGAAWSSVLLAGVLVAGCGAAGPRPADDSALSPATSSAARTTTPVPADPPSTTVPPPVPADPPPAPPREPVEAVFLGDSYTVGTGDPDASGYVPDVAAAMGWVAIGQGQGGTGYVNPGPGSGAFAGRVAAIVAEDPDVVVVQGSTNDVGSPPRAVEDAALGLYAALRTGLPRARIVAVGPVAAPVVRAEVQPIRDAVARAAARSGVDFLDPVASRWLESPDWYGDGLHPDDAGYRAFAGDLVAGLRALGY